MTTAQGRLMRGYYTPEPLELRLKLDLNGFLGKWENRIDNAIWRKLAVILGEMGLRQKFKLT